MNYLEVAAIGGLLALANAAHCAGMCGVFALKAASLRSSGPWGGLSLYGAGKTFSYVFFGTVGGFLGHQLGQGVRSAQAVLGIGVAAVMLWVGFRLIVPGAPTRFGASVTRLFSPLLATIRQLGGGRSSGFILGALSAAIPCGVVYLAVLEAAATGRPVLGALLMLAFGLGTLPVLFAVGCVGRLAPERGGRRLAVAGGVCLLLIGLWTGWRALLPLLQYGSEIAPSCCN